MNTERRSAQPGGAPGRANRQHHGLLAAGAVRGYSHGVPTKRGEPPLPILPTPDQLRIRRLGTPRRGSPLASRDVVLVADELGVLIPSDTQTLADVVGPVPAFEAAGPRARLFFDPPNTSIGIVTCGGLCPGINDVIRAIVLTAWHVYGVRRVLFRYGYAGLSASSGLADDRPDGMTSMPLAAPSWAPTADSTPPTSCSDARLTCSSPSAVTALWQALRSWPRRSHNAVCLSRW